MILCLESSSDACSVALGATGHPTRWRRQDTPRLHAEQLVPLVLEVLDEAGVATAELSAIAVSAGPGSYTGLRIGVSTAKGLAMSANLPLIGVPTLEALGRSRATDGLTLAVTLARKTEVYVADSRDGYRQAHALEVDELAARLKPLTDDPWTVVGPAAALLDRAASEAGLPPPTTFDVTPDARMLLPVAIERFSVRKFVDADAFEPYYVKPARARPARQSAFDRLTL